MPRSFVPSQMSACFVPVESFTKNGNVSVFGKTLDFLRDANFEPPLYNIWSFAAKSNEVSHFGNSEQRILDNLAKVAKKKAGQEQE